MKVLFRFEASPEVGLGHKARCLALANCLRRSEAFSGVVAAQSASAAAPNLDFAQLRAGPDDIGEFGDLVRELQPDLVVADSYSLTAEWFEQVGRTGAPILRLSDRPSPAMGCSYILDQSPAHGPSDYPIDDESCQLMVGASWALLDPSFFNHRHVRRTSAPGGLRLLVAMGGGAGDETSAVLDQLRHIDEPLSVTVIQPNDSGRRRSESVAGQLHHDVRIVSTTSTMAAMMFEHDVSIGAGGVTALERCVVGLPSALMAIAENQEPNVRALIEQGAALACNLDDIAGTIRALEQRATSLGRSARTVCDGLGALRCARKLGAQIPVELREAAASIDDKELAFGQQLIPGVREHSRTATVPTWDEHDPWYDDTILRRDRQLYFIEVGGFVVGQIRTDERAGGSAELSILLTPEARGMSIASDAIRQLTRQSVGPLLAHISPENGPSIAAFRAAGFTQVAVDQYRYEPLGA